ncbi:hypothetical protein VIGAN_11062800, partial [Vigna angularis var. angularis]
TDFSVKLQNKFRCSRKIPSLKRSISEATLKRVSRLFGSFSILSSQGETRGIVRQQSSAAESFNPPMLKRNASTASDISSTASQGGPTLPGYTLEI